MKRFLTTNPIDDRTHTATCYLSYLIGNISAKKFRVCSEIPEETCREVTVPQCRLVPTKRAVFRTVKECQQCETHSQLVVTRQYQKTCQRLQTEKCHTEYQEVEICRLD